MGPPAICCDLTCIAFQAGLQQTQCRQMTVFHGHVQVKERPASAAACAAGVTRLCRANSWQISVRYAPVPDAVLDADSPAGVAVRLCAVAGTRRAILSFVAPLKSANSVRHHVVDHDEPMTRAARMQLPVITRIWQKEADSQVLKSRNHPTHMPLPHRLGPPPFLRRAAGSGVTAPAGDGLLSVLPR